jgi:RecB family exonuclease
MSDHSHVMGGSSATKRINCPASYQLEAAMPEGTESSSYADRGSMLHAAMELLLTADPANADALDATLQDLLGQDLGFAGHEITQELVDTKILPAWNAWCHVRDTYDLVDWFIEQRVSLEAIIDGAFGTADLIASDRHGRLHVLDWKFGDGVIVPAEGNQGMLFYAGAALNDMDPEMREFIEEIGDANNMDPIPVVIHIVQPRAGAKPEEVLQTWETNEDTVDKFITLAAEAIDKARSSNPQPKPGDWCRWCRAQPTCPAYDQLVDYATSTSPKTMSAHELSEAIRAAKLLTDWCRKVLALGQQELEGGAAIPGYKLVPKRPQRVWVNAEVAEEVLRKKRCKVGEMYKRTLMSPAQFEKSRGDVYAKIAKDHVVSVSSGVTMVEDTDPRPAIVGEGQLLAEAYKKAGIAIEKQELKL